MSVSLSRSAVRTRKEHRCFGCNHAFPSGSILLSESIVWDGAVLTNYWCQDCYHALAEMSRGWTIDDWETLSVGEIGCWKDGVWRLLEVWT